MQVHVVHTCAHAKTHKTLQKKKKKKNKDGLSGDAATAISYGYAYLGQDVRGRYLSNGSYSFWRTDGNDTIDTIAWLLQQTWSDSLMGVQGVSADAIAHYVDFAGVMTDTLYEKYFVPEFKAIQTAVLLVGTNMLHETCYQGGAYVESLISGWLTEIGEASYIDTVLENEPFGPYWYPINGDFQSKWDLFDFPMVHFAGWYDIFSTTQIQVALAINETEKNEGGGGYKDIRIRILFPITTYFLKSESSEGAKGQQILMIDAGGHCEQGAINWPNNSYGLDLLLDTLLPEIYAGAFESAKHNVPFDIHSVIPWNVLFYMLGPGGLGSEGNYWIAAESLPPVTSYLTYYLDGSGSSGALNLDLPQGSGTKQY
ncbi:hypothetical protein RFI_31193, partial [Reticulomyxa filosa]